MTQNPLDLSTWTDAHHLVNMYVAIAQLSGYTPDTEAERRLFAKFHERMPEISVQRFKNIWRMLTSLYHSMQVPWNSNGRRKQRYTLFLRSATTLAQQVNGNTDQAMALIRDLVDIAGSHGFFRENDIAMIQAAGRASGLRVDLSIDTKRQRAKVEFSEID